MVRIVFKVDAVIPAARQASCAPARTMTRSIFRVADAGETIRIFRAGHAAAAFPGGRIRSIKTHGRCYSGQSGGASQLEH